MWSSGMKAELLKRGSIWLVDWSPGRGLEQEGIRPALVVQTDLANQNPKYPNVIIVTISTKGRPLPFHISVTPTALNGLNQISYIKCEQILTISKDRLFRYCGFLEADILKKVDVALKGVLNIQ